MRLTPPTLSSSSASQIAECCPTSRRHSAASGLRPDPEISSPACPNRSCSNSYLLPAVNASARSAQSLLLERIRHRSRGKGGTK